MDLMVAANGNAGEKKRVRVNWGDILDEAWGEDSNDSDALSGFAVRDSLPCKDKGGEVKTAITASARQLRCLERKESNLPPRAYFPFLLDGPQEVVHRGKENKSTKQQFCKSNLHLVKKGGRKRRRTVSCTSGSRLQRRRKLTDASKRESLRQLCLDLGQKSFGHSTCPVCGMVYTLGQAEDEGEHEKFHRKYLTGISFHGWKNERVVGEFFDGRIVVVYPSDPKHHLKKMQELCALVDSELGYAAGIRPWHATTKV